MPNNDKKKQPRRDEKDQAEDESRQGQPANEPDDEAEVSEEESRLFEDHGVRDDSPGRKF